MPSEFIRGLAAEGHLAANEENLFSGLNIQTADELLAVVWNFRGCLSEQNFNLPRISAAAANLTSAGFIQNGQQSGAVRGTPPQFRRGAEHPDAAPADVGFSAPTVAGSPRGGGGGAGGPLDFRMNSWPVRDQGDRGTCVGFALTACVEHFVGRNEHPLSEQYLYWATKKHSSDPSPSTDGSRLEYAIQGIDLQGICLAQFWQYDPNELSGNVTHEEQGKPSSGALGDATSRRHKPAIYVSGTGGGNAQILLTTLNSRQRPIAISLPVFEDFKRPGSDNWNTQTAIDVGKITDPVPSSVVVGGHAVCVTGFVPDANEAGGGWFIFRNSWGTTGWSRSPLPPYVSPEPGYGQISASYVDQYLWEMCCL